MFKQIEEYIEGVTCSNCWGSGKTFGDIPTPKRITLTGSDFPGACSVFNDTIIATQDPVNSCRWKFDDGTRYGNWFFGPVGVTCFLAIRDVGICFNGSAGLCSKSITWMGRTVTVAIADPPTPEFKIAVDHNFSPSLQTHYLNLGAANSAEVLILARRLDRIRLHCRFAPDY